MSITKISLKQISTGNTNDNKYYLTNRVILVSISSAMTGISTITQKGQVAIPKPIRDHFQLKPSDKLYFEVKDDLIVARRVSSIDEMRGIAKSNKLFSKKENKETVRKSILSKFARKSV